MPPRTPYTPYTAFASKQNPFEASFDSQPHILDDADDPLAALYNTILRFVDRDMKRIMELAEKVGVKSTAKTSMGKAALLGSAAPPQKESVGGFEIMANVVWSEIGKAVMDELGSTVFAVGKPDEFRKVIFETFLFPGAVLTSKVSSITRRPKHSSGLSSTWRLPWRQWLLCALTPSTWRSNDAGNSPCISN